ncbi:hypothetical protein GGS26DRAFT_578881 [Hypomontagnella submonticulosa]|nr:hypothetical protein GGS26DRAFT_578881 [Hypomontagnella submonticulosa]
MADGEAFALLAIGLTLIFLRVWARWASVGPSKWQLDDYLMPMTGVMFTLETVAAYLVGALFQGLTNSYMTDEQRESLDPYSREYSNRQWGSKIQVIGWSFYACILWMLKVCVAVFYGRLTNGLVDFTFRVRIAYVLLGVTYVFVALSLLLGCQPLTKYWQIYPDPGNLCQPTNSRLSVLVVVIPNILTDCYLLSIPMPLLWMANISFRHKLTLMVLFSGAVFVMVAGIIRAAVILEAGPEGAVSGSQWACRETFVSIVVSNLPIVHPYLRKFATKFGLGIAFTKTGASAPSHQHRSKTLSTGFKSSRNKSGYPPCTPQSTAWGSDENILVPHTDDRHLRLPENSRDIVVLKEVTITTNGQARSEG